MSNAKAEFFDAIADKWDGWEDLEVLGSKLAAGFQEMGVGPSETVLDVGCGTGNLTQALLAHLGPLGRVIAVDISPRMIGVARAKVTDARVSWHVADAKRLPLPPESCDRVLCYSVWPHFDDVPAIVQEFLRVLRPSGSLHVWHLIGRDRVNEIHRTAGPAVKDDILQPANETAAVLSKLEFQVTKALDIETHYLVSAIRPAN